MAPIKVLVAGPKESGKTTIANFLSEHTDRLQLSEQYVPTVGVRILEMDKANRSIELWDVSGDQMYETCWPAILKDVNAVVVVYDPSSHSHESEITLWVEWFVQSPNIQHCLVFQHQRDPVEDGDVGKKIKFPPGTNVIQTNADAPTVLKSAFDQFMDRVTKQSRK